jgi:signal transduction histidine kinase
MTRGPRSRAAAPDRASDTLHRALVDAVSVGSDRGTRAVLGRIVQAACELSGAQYGALGVVGPNHALADVIVEGLTDEEIARIGEFPHGHGLFGTLIDDPRPLRLRRISEHPAAHGFPPNHPKMTSFLGVPVYANSRLFGLLYLADKRAADEFTATDERAVVALAATAGEAIENAWLYVLSQRRGRWLEASADITRMLLERADRDMALRAVAKRARELSGSDASCILLDEEGTSDLVVQEVDGDAAEDLRGRTVPSDHPALERVLTEGLATTVPDLHSILGSAAEPSATAASPALLVPFRSSSNAAGILLVVEPSPPPSREDEYMLQSFADQAAIALDLAQARADSETVVVLEDRDRIARDLHDVVIQRMFATGLMLQGAQRAAVRKEVRDRIETAVNELDVSIRDLRTTIFELHHPTPASLRSELSRLMADYANVLGFLPRLSTRGPLNTVIDAQLRAQVLAVLREALSNVAKHAQATMVDIDLAAGDREVSARIVDDGVGIDEAAYESGLRNLRARARVLGGSVTIHRAVPQGTVLEWRVPLGSPGTAQAGA